MPKVYRKMMDGTVTVREVTDAERNEIVEKGKKGAAVKQAADSAAATSESSSIQGTKGVSGSTGYEPDRVGGS